MFSVLSHIWCHNPTLTHGLEFGSSSAALSVGFFYRVTNCVLTQILAFLKVTSNDFQGTNLVAQRMNPVGTKIRQIHAT